MKGTKKSYSIPVVPNRKVSENIKTANAQWNGKEFDLIFSTMTPMLTESEPYRKGSTANDVTISPRKQSKRVI